MPKQRVIILRIAAKKLAFLGLQPRNLLSYSAGSRRSMKDNLEIYEKKKKI